MVSARFTGRIMIPRMDFELASVSAGTWAVFQCVGPMPDAIQNMWERIYSEWLPQPNMNLLMNMILSIIQMGIHKARIIKAKSGFR